MKIAISPPKSHINNSYEFVEKIKNSNIPDKFVFISLDVTSLFTNIPVELVKSSLDKRASTITKKCLIPYGVLLECVEFIFDNNYFVFDQKFYKQISGIPMGDKLSPLFANMVMGDLENQCLNILKNSYNITPLWYARFMDDSAMAVHIDHVEQILHFQFLPPKIYP